MSEMYGVERDSTSVRAWSVRRLPFEPRGWLCEYREALRHELRALGPVDGARLRAVYASPDREFADVENVLLYNVGSANYRHLVAGGLEASRVRSTSARHEVTYELTTDALPVFDGPPVAAVEIPELPRQRDKPAAWWAAAGEGLRVLGDPIESDFVTAVTVRTSLTQAASWLKPMLDGVISALHVHDGSHEPRIRQTLVDVGDPEMLWARLNRADTNLLGAPRRLVRPHGTRVAWNPADERCSHFVVTQDAKGPAVQVIVSAESSGSSPTEVSE